MSPGTTLDCRDNSLAFTFILLTSHHHLPLRPQDLLDTLPFCSAHESLLAVHYQGEHFGKYWTSKRSQES